MLCNSAANLKVMKQASALKSQAQTSSKSSKDPEQVRIYQRHSAGKAPEYSWRSISSVREGKRSINACESKSSSPPSPRACPCFTFSPLFDSNLHNLSPSLFWCNATLCVITSSEEQRRWLHWMSSAADQLPLLFLNINLCDARRKSQGSYPQQSHKELTVVEFFFRIFHQLIHQITFWEAVDYKLVIVFPDMTQPDLY